MMSHKMMTKFCAEVSNEKKWPQERSYSTSSVGNSIQRVTVGADSKFTELTM